MNKEMIRKNNEIVRELKAQGYDVAWREEEKKTIIFIPGGATEHLKIVGYITKDNEVVMYEDKGIKELFKELEELEKESNRLDNLMEENPCNEEIEKAFDEAYKKEWEVFNKLIDEVVKFTEGKIGRKQAYNMIQLKRSELKSIIEMMQRKEMKEMIKFEKGQVFRNEEDNIFIKGVNGRMVKYIEGYSPLAIHDIQVIPAENLEKYINKWGYKRCSKEVEKYIDC